MAADEAFATGTAAGLIAIKEIRGRMIGNGEEGPTTKKLREAYFKEVVPKNLTPFSHAGKKFDDVVPEKDYHKLKEELMEMKAD